MEAIYDPILGKLRSEKVDLSGVYPNLTAGDITPKSESPIEIIGRYIAQTTGGDADIKNGAAYLRIIKGFLDNELNPFIADTFVSTGMNLVDPNVYYNYSNVKMYYFPVVAGVWGEYGTTQDNNGYVIFGDDIVPGRSVYFVTGKPMSASGVAIGGEPCPYEEHEGKTYYLPPSDGWMCIFTMNLPACHIAWSNYKDDEAGTFCNSVIDISAAITAVHSWGLAGFVTAGKVVQDVIDLENGVGYQYCDRVRLQDLSWSMETVTTTDENDETTTTYVFSARISDMAANGLYKHALEGYEGVENDGNLIIISTPNVSSVADLKESLGDTLMYYEKATPVEVNLSEIGTEFTANDFGLTYFLYNNELATTYAYVTAAFYQGGKDQLFNAVSYQKLLAEVVATALCEVNQRLDGIENRKSVSCTNLVVERKFDMAGWRHVDTQPAAATSPGRVGDYYITSTYLFICVDKDTWKKIAISNF